MAIVIAILVALALIGLGYSAFLSDDDAGTDADSSDTSELDTVDDTGDTSTESEDPINSADDIDREIESLTNDLDSLNNEPGFDEDALTDETLGL